MVRLIKLFVFVVAILACVLVLYKSNKKTKHPRDVQACGRESNVFRYVISFLIPLVGYIMGAILLSKDNETDKTIGKKCIIIGIVSAIVGGVVTAIFLTSMF